jgi:hypothetical protein
MIHGGATVRIVLCDVQRDLLVAQFGHETVGIVNLVIVRANVCGVEQTRQIGA